jgi:hypothetical protein
VIRFTPYGSAEAADNASYNSDAVVFSRACSVQTCVEQRHLQNLVVQHLNQWFDGAIYGLVQWSTPMRIVVVDRSVEAMFV